MQFKLEDLPPNTKPYKVLLWDRIKNMKATPVTFNKGTQEAYRKIGWGMVATCLSDDGIGLAAPQIGIFKKAILVREFKKKNNDDDEYEILPSFRLYLNPSWKGQSEKGKDSLKEWCLSVPGKGFSIERFLSIKATWYEFVENEPVQKEGAFDHFPARIWEHETDHLIGISIPQRWKMQNVKSSRKKRKKRKRNK